MPNAPGAEMGLQEFLENKLEELRRERDETRQVLDVIQAKIKQADAKRSTQTDTEYYHKWSSILSGLEKDLDRTRGQLAALEAEIDEKTRRLEELAEKARAEAERKEKIADNVMEMSVDELANLSFEEIALLQEKESAHAAAARAESGRGADAEEPTQASEREELPPEPESTDQPTVEPQAEAGPAKNADDATATDSQVAAGQAFEEPEQQAEIMRALRKVVTSPGTLTFAEFELLIDFCKATAAGAAAGHTQERLRKAAAVALKKADHESARIRQKLAEIGGLDNP